MTVAVTVTATVTAVCMRGQIVYVTGGEELTVTSSAAASTVSNVHFEVIGYTSLVLDVPDLTVTGIYQSVSVGTYLLFSCSFVFKPVCLPAHFSVETPVDAVERR